MTIYIVTGEFAGNGPPYFQREPIRRYVRAPSRAAAVAQINVEAMLAGKLFLSASAVAATGPAGEDAAS